MHRKQSRAKYLPSYPQECVLNRDTFFLWQGDKSLITTVAIGSVHRDTNLHHNRAGGWANKVTRQGLQWQWVRVCGCTRLVFLYEVFEIFIGDVMWQFGQRAILQVPGLTVGEVRKVGSVQRFAKRGTCAWFRRFVLTLGGCNKNGRIILVLRHDLFICIMACDAMWSPSRVHIQQDPFTFRFCLELCLRDLVMRVSGSANQQHRKQKFHGNCGLQAQANLSHFCTIRQR